MRREHRSPWRPRQSVGDLGEQRREVAAVRALLTRAGDDHTQPRDVDDADTCRHLDAVPSQHRDAVAVRPVPTVVVAGDDDNRHRHRSEHGPQRVVFVVVVLVGEVALHDDQLRSPGDGLAQRGARAHNRIRLGRIAPLRTRADPRPTAEAALAEVQIADRRDASELRTRRWRERAGRSHSLHRVTPRLRRRRARPSISALPGPPPSTSRVGPPATESVCVPRGRSLQQTCTRSTSTAKISSRRAAPVPGTVSEATRPAGRTLACGTRR